MSWRPNFGPANVPRTSETEAAAAGQDREKRKATESIKYYLRLLVESGLCLGKKRDFPAFRHLFFIFESFFLQLSILSGKRRRRQKRRRKRSLATTTSTTISAQLTFCQKIELQRRINDDDDDVVGSFCRLSKDDGNDDDDDND